MSINYLAKLGTQAKKVQKKPRSNKILKLSLKEIMEGWGSLESFMEEQRRCGMHELEIGFKPVA